MSREPAPAGPLAAGLGAALLNLLADAQEERSRLTQTQHAMVNILHDAHEASARSLSGQRAMANLLADGATERDRLTDTQRAVTNLLADAHAQQGQLSAMQSALLNILGDTEAERAARERAQAEVQVLNRELESRVAQRTADLSSANRDLEQFSYNVSHNLRSPARAIQGFATLLLSEHKAELTPEGRHFAEQIVEGGREMGVLIDGLINLAHVAQEPLRREAVDMERLAEAAWQNLRPAATGRDIAFHLGTLPPSAGDARLLGQVWAALLENAVKFTSSHATGRIEVGALREADGGVTYFVRDDGVGFDPKHAGKLFQPFERLHSHAEFPGVGVGLALVARIVERHGGSVRAEGAPGEGATFSFTIPKRPEVTP